jgi:hypothetical protein
MSLLVLAVMNESWRNISSLKSSFGKEVLESLWKVQIEQVKHHERGVETHSGLLVVVQKWSIDGLPNIVQR